MKKRFLAVLVAITMLATTMASIGAMADTAARVNTYFDISFDNWTDATTILNSDGSSAPLYWSFTSGSRGIAEDSARMSNVLKFDKTADDTDATGRKYTEIRTTNSSGLPLGFNKQEVVWFEFSVMFEDSFADVGWDHNNGISPVYVDKTGMLCRFGKRTCSSPADGRSIGYQLELGKWYHIVSALDMPNAPQGDGGRLYVWVNGTKVFDGTDYHSLVGPNTSDAFKYYRFYVDAPSSGEATTYVDNMKGYTTSALDTHAEDEFDIDLTDADEDDYISIDGDVITTPSKATIGDIKAAFPEADFKFMKDGAEITDDDAGVAGVTAYIYSESGLAFRAYELTPDTVTYPVAVEEGCYENYSGNSGAGEYSVGDKVTIDAGRMQGYKFTHWTVEGMELADPTQKIITFIMDGTAKTFTANWEYIPTYRVEVIDSYADISGDGEYYDGEDVTIDAGDRLGYSFAGWTVEGMELADPMAKTVNFTMDTVEKTFTANWELIPTYKVEVAGSYAEDSGAGEYYEGDTVTIHAGERANADFNRWQPTGVTLGSNYEETTTFVMPANDVKIVASWNTYTSAAGGGGGVRTAEYKVKFETNGGSAVDTVELEKGKTLTPLYPTKEGFIFEGWYLDAELTQRLSNPYEVTKNVTLYAKWIDETEVEKNDKPSEKDTWKNPFNDVKESSWYYEPIKYMYERQYCEGFGWGQFGPDVNLSRAMLVTILHRIEGEPAAAASSTFADVEAGSWYADAVTWAAENGIVTGYNSYSFAPDDLITREQIAAILYRYAQLKGQSVAESADISGFEDSSLVSSYAHSSLGWAVAKGYISGRTETSIAPADNATRAEALTVLYRFIK